ncbi:zinc finger BED domain-containing protein 5-like [Sparus aurata]|uniref:zinc finger BED domain-containing protein 5-like n=1 Tax=Sparus aurata TaxID=8175 RepID=UPI0011C19680|nr:zinc finger BED domain-containing protein 5-like [Sparus aurata]
MAENKKKCRQYNANYINYGFIPSPANVHLPMCLLCEQVFSNEAMKPSRLQEHLSKKHPDKASKDSAYFQSLRDQRSRRPTINTMFARSVNQTESGLVASYNIALLIAKAGLPFTVGESLVIPAIKEAISTVMQRDPAPVTKAIPLSNDSVARRIREMSMDTEQQLCATLRGCRFSIQLDETTTADNNVLLMAYVRYVSGRDLHEDFLFGEYLATDTRGETIFAALTEFLRERDIPVTNIIACATDGAPAMVGRYRGFATLLKQQVPQVLTVHCILHCHNLVAKKMSPSLHQSLDVAVKAINKIKADALNDRLFRQLCGDNDEAFKGLLLHTEVRWLSKGNCLARLCELFPSVIEFLDQADATLKAKLWSCRHDIFYLSDFFGKMNEVTLKLQGWDDAGPLQGHRLQLLAKLELYQQNLGRRQFINFPQLAKVLDELTDSHLLLYTDHLKAVKADMAIRFRDLQQLDVPDWVMEPWKADAVSCEPEIQESLIDLQNDEEAKATFRTSGWRAMWVTQGQRFPPLWERVHLLLLAFPTSYLVEQGFSQVLHMQTKYRNRLNLVSSGALRLKLISQCPDVKKLAAAHQAQGSH